MSKHIFVYHGSCDKLVGDKLLPKQAVDYAEIPENSLQGVYASDIKEEAIATGIVSGKGVISASCGIKNNKVEAIIYEGWPIQEYFYLYILDAATFECKPEGSHQYISPEAVKPVKTEKLLVKEYIHLIRKASEEERIKWKEKHQLK